MDDTTNRFRIICFSILAFVFTGCPDETKPNEEIAQPLPTTQQQCSQSSDCEMGYACISGICLEDVTDTNETTDAGATTTSIFDAGQVDTSNTIDSGNADNSTVTDAGPLPNPFAIQITQPLTERGFFAIDAVTFKAIINTVADFDATTARVHWSTEDTPELYTGFDTVSLTSSFTAALNPGHQNVTVKLLQNEVVLAEDTIALTICEHGTLLDFSVEPDDSQWYSLVDRGNTNRNIWHQDGYVELTNTYSQHAALFYLGQKIDPGDLRMTLKVSLGHCSTPGYCASSTDGADGFAVSIFDLPDATSLQHLIENHTTTGGTLGFLLVNDASGNPPPVVDAFHLEFDTYFNQLSWGHSHTDPTTQDHIQVHVDGNMIGDLDDSPDSVTELWAAVPELEDNEWHDVEIVISGNQLRVTWDASIIIEGTVPNFNFKGGFLGVTSTTGGLYSYQRIDDFNIIDNCPYEAPPE